MKLDFDLADYRYTGGSKRFSTRKAPTKVKNLYRDEAHYVDLLRQYRAEISELQEMLFAHNRYALCLVFQAMDAAGKDGTIKHVMSGVDPQGVEVHSFKKPSDDELNHDFMWRSSSRLPPRGRIGIFNRSYYEEVLICQVHPEIVTRYQRLPDSAKKDMGKLFDRRREDIANFEGYAYRNGVRIVKFMLNVSRDEQRARFLERIEEPAKNWKFNAADVAERQHWEAYMDAYDDAITATASKEIPWYIIPADGKKNMRLLVSAAILEEMQRMDLHWPVLPPEQKAELAKCREALLAE